MKRLITYLFQYEHGIKGRNIGFVKTDIRNENVQMEIHMKGLGKYQGTGKVYALVMSPAVMGICIGEIGMLQGNSLGKLLFSSAQIMDSSYGLNDVIGIGIKFGNMYYAASNWKEENYPELSNGTFKEWEKENKTEKLNGYITNKKPDEEMKNKKDVQGMEINQMPDLADEQKMTEPDAPSEEYLSGQPKDESKEEKPQGEQSRGEEQQVEAQQRAEQQTNQIQIKRIDINTIRKLPKRNWYLCNNSFLIHGYFNYHYLIMKTVVLEGREKAYLGVPGIYEKPEKVMAMLFGFPEFQSEKALSEMEKMPDENLEPEEGTFGFWFCLLDM